MSGGAPASSLHAFVLCKRLLSTVRSRVKAPTCPIPLPVLPLNVSPNAGFETRFPGTALGPKSHAPASPSARLRARVLGRYASELHFERLAGSEWLEPPIAGVDMSASRMPRTTGSDCE